MTRHSRLEPAAALTVQAAALAAMITACVMDGVEPVRCSSGVVCAPNWKCVDEGQSCEPATCGDKYRDWDNGEVCDDGNTVSGDGCSANCLSLESCGNGQVDPGEDCDPTDAESAAGCNTRCRRTPMCGNGAIDPGEECDDGEDDTPRATARCDEDCTRALCGDRVVNKHVMNAAGEPETCDAGGINTATCDADCTLPDCGDGVYNAAAEECDDDNHSDDDGCVDECKLATCGDGHIRVDVEECEIGSDPRECDLQDCTAPVCGDGVHNAAAGEECDDGNHSNNDDCVKDCKPADCGDGYLWVGVEDCETEADSETCDADCSAPSCGDGQVNEEAGEPCDDGNEFVFDGCLADENGKCKLATCGDGIIRIGYEQCDDGNADPHDDCPSGPDRACQVARCGDGIEHDNHETCDTAGDSETCDSDCTPVQCGDGHVNLVVEQMNGGCENNLNCSLGQRCVPRMDAPTLCHCE